MQTPNMTKIIPRGVDVFPSTQTVLLTWFFPPEVGLFSGTREAWRTLPFNSLIAWYRNDLKHDPRRPRPSRLLHEAVNSVKNDFSLGCVRVLLFQSWHKASTWRLLKSFVKPGQLFLHILTGEERLETVYSMAIKVYSIQLHSFSVYDDRLTF